MTDSSHSSHCPVCGSRLSTDATGKTICGHCHEEPPLSSEALTAESPATALDPEAPTQASDDGRTAVHDAADHPGSAPVSLSTGQVLGGRYRVLELLGRGGMGEVWRAYDVKLRLDVALKSLHTFLRDGDEGLELLRGEVRAAREVISPNVCRLFDLVEVDGRELVSMEYIDGQTLLGLLAERGPLDLEEAREIGSQFLAGLEAIHQAGLVHRDIKPENIMRTRSGRVVIMDFGLTSPSGEGVLAGTPAYMAPEQARGEATDARADVFSAAMVLAEMLSAERGPGSSSRQTFWTHVRQDPPRLPETPWTRVLLPAVAMDRNDRPSSAAELARQLDEIAVRVEGAEDETPYPGLASFSSQSAQFFFGREAEVEAVWKKLQQAYLLGLIGASGSGKSSFVNAGLVPVKPEGWGHLVIKPGRAPFGALGRALLPELQGADEAVDDLLSLDDPDRAVSALERWRAQHQEVVLIVDQFEELFTQNPIEVQERFIGLLSRTAVDGDIRVLLSMRDDFLMHCQRFSALAPVFSELTPLGPPVGSALRRALVQPALRLGYRFEDDSMVEEMLDEVTRERGALPLIAFTAARLWDERDSERGLLTREAYDRMGGVEGALAQHAEATLDRIGRDKVPIVRELFRNLVTAEGTRAVMQVDEVLSIFGSQEGEEQFAGQSTSGALAAEILQQIIDARLLTAYEVRSEDGRAPQRRVELVHESLLSAWPRLVRWRAQDAEGAQLRDELRQAAKLWDARGRSDDLLWAGTALREFELWRERYPGRLTAVEGEFAAAMLRLAERRRRRRQVAVAAVLSSAVLVTAITGTLWRRSESARQEAVAAELLALARVTEGSYPTGALAYATRSLEVVDSPEARRLAVKTLWRGPPARIVPLEGEELLHLIVAVSPDGRWIATSDIRSGKILLVSRETGSQKLLWTHPTGEMSFLTFLPGSDALVAFGYDPETRVFSVPDGELVRTLRPGPAGFEGNWAWTWAKVRGDRILTVAIAEEAGGTFIQSWPIAGDEARSLGMWTGTLCEPNSPWDIGPSGIWLVCASGEILYRLELEGFDEASAQRLGSLEEEIGSVAVSPSGRHLALTDGSGRIHLWSIDGASAEPLRVVDGSTQDGFFKPRFDPSGSWLTWGSQAKRSVFLLDLDSPPDVAPTALPVPSVMVRSGAFDAEGRWLATVHDTYVVIWSLDGEWFRQFPPTGLVLWGPLGLTPDGRQLASAHLDGLRVWPLELGQGSGGKIEGFDSTWFLATHPTRPEILAGRSASGPLNLLSLRDDSRRELLPRIHEASLGALAFDAEGRRAAAGVHGSSQDPAEQVLRVWQLDSGEMQTLPLEDHGQIDSLAFHRNGDLFSAGLGGVRLWDLAAATSTSFLASEFAKISLSADRRHALVISGELADQYVQRARLFWIDLESGERREIQTHSDSLQFASLGPDGRVVVTADADGVMRVGPVTGEAPHLLLGHAAGGVTQPVVSPDGRWIFTGAGAEIRQWPMPDLSRPPLHTLSLEELLRYLHSRTNVRVMEDPESPEGWKLDTVPLSGNQDHP